MLDKDKEKSINKYINNFYDLTVMNDQEVDELEKKEQKQLWQESFNQWLNNSGIETRYRNADIETVKDNEMLKKWTDNSTGAFLILGNYGTGKTYTAIAMLLYKNRYQEKKANNFSGFYVSIPELEFEYDDSRSFQSKIMTKQLLDTYSKKSLLVIDEIGRGSNKAVEQKILYYILNKRYNNKLPTILISNLNAKSFAEYVGEPIVDRIAESRFIYDMHGESKRRNKQGA